MLSTPQLTCRVCPHDVPLSEVFSLGTLDCSGFPLPDDPVSPRAAPLRLGVCPVCTLVQLMDTVPFNELFRTYWYQSGINERMVTELGTIVTEARRRAPTGSARDYVIDIGANDGTLLAQYAQRGQGYLPRRLAFESATNLHAQLRDHAEILYPVPFPPLGLDSLVSAVQQQGGATIITAIAMAYDLQDPNAFWQAVRRLLHPDGVCVVQFQDLGQMLRTTAFDNICHEHLEYYSLHSVQRMIHHNALTVYDVQESDINGGSLRLFIGHAETTARRPAWAPPDAAVVTQALAREEALGLLEMDTLLLAFRRFQGHVAHRKTQVLSVLEAVRDAGGIIAGYGASTKGNTLLQHFGLDASWITSIAERSPAKVGRVTAGTRIPIVDETDWRRAHPELTLVPIWQFRPQVCAREVNYLQLGGRFLFPLPSCLEVSK